MNPDDAFERIVDALHGAAQDDALWPEASALIDEACGAAGNVVLVGEGTGAAARLHFGRLLYRGEPGDDLLREYYEVYHPHDEAPPRRIALPSGRLVPLRELYTDEERKTSAAFNEGWARVRGQKGLTVHFHQPDGVRIFWGVGDPVGGDGWEPARLALVERLAPHVRHFVTTRQALAAAGALGAGLAGLLENDRIGVVQLDRAGRVLAANAPALEILRRGDGLADRGGALHAALPADGSRLQRLLGRALPDVWGEPPAAGSMTVQRPSGRARLGLHVAPVGNGAGDFGGHGVAALVLLVDPARGARIDAGRVSAMLGLTPSEGRVAALLAGGLRVREIAAATGFTEKYVRWLLQQVYGKLGISGQVALVRQVLAVDALPRG